MNKYYLPSFWGVGGKQFSGGLVSTLTVYFKKQVTGFWFGLQVS